MEPEESSVKNTSAICRSVAKTRWSIVGSGSITSSSGVPGSL